MSDSDSSVRGRRTLRGAGGVVVLGALYLVHSAYLGVVSSPGMLASRSQPVMWMLRTFPDRETMPP